jgi:hypothetical protein
LGDSGGRLLALPLKPPQAPSPDGGAGLLSSRCSDGEVLAMGDQPLVQVAGEQRDAVGAGVVPEEMAGGGGLSAAAGAVAFRFILPLPLSL